MNWNQAQEWWDGVSARLELDREFYGNPLEKWLAALAVVVLALILVRLLVAIIGQRAATIHERTGSDLADSAARLMDATRWWFLMAFAIWLGSLTVILPDATTLGVRTAVTILLLLQAASWGNVAISFLLTRARHRMADDAAGLTMIATLGFIGRMGLWIVVGLLILENLGVEVSALIAGLGVGGIAVALAAQNILGDLFASLSIVLDKPFVLGDFIIVGDFMGTVEKIGLKTTRLRSLSGEQIIMANSDLLQSRVRNYKRMSERRIAFSIGVTYQTPHEKLQAVPGLIREAVEACDQARFDRSHFKSFGDSALNFETVYYVLAADYAIYMDIQQQINLDLYRRFEQEAIEFAYPTQTLFVQMEDGQPAVH
ncbi:MAG: mechanosensitive ion channel family protein [Planctomycetaceae bacterium]|nr:mechanosensitive ion channel family protein [Planctomycetaceae bacterium]